VNGIHCLKPADANRGSLTRLTPFTVCDALRYFAGQTL